MIDRPLISLCMIVRDGGEAFAHCLASVRGLVDEMVVVDTGSTDDSVVRARSAGAQVWRRPWDDDFSAARNFGLEQARGRWILVLDADESLPAVEGSALRARLERASEWAFHLPVRSPTSDGESLEVSILRLFRRHPQIRYRGRIHEQIVADLERRMQEEGGTVGFLHEPLILHQGYRPEEEQRRGKVERNDRIFRKALAECPRDAYLWYKFADALRARPAARSEARQASVRALELVAEMPEERRRRLPWWPELLAIHAFEKLREGRAHEIESLLRDHPPEGCGSPSWCYVAAAVAENLGHWEQAERWIREAIDGPVRPNAPQRPGIRGSRGYLLRARIDLQRGEWRRAEEWVARAMEGRKPWAELDRVRAAALWGRGERSQALTLLQKSYRRDPDPQTVRLLRRLRDRLSDASETRRSVPNANLALSLLDDGLAPGC